MKAFFAPINNPKRSNRLATIAVDTNDRRSKGSNAIGFATPAAIVKCPMKQGYPHDGVGYIFSAYGTT